MGIYTDYLDLNMGFEQLSQERKKWLKEISRLRSNRDILVYSVDINKRAQTSIDHSDVIPFTDLLNSLPGNDGIDIILQTPGGIADVVETFVNAIRKKYKNVAVIIPGMAMSAGTIFTMAADEILMGQTSSLGPIDAQILSNGRQYSADAFLEGLNKIKEEVEKTDKLNPAYIPILQNITIGEIQDYENAQKLSASLVTDWLVKYKFSHWQTHSKDGSPVTLQEREERAKEIAEALGKHSKWLTHSRPLGIKELCELKLQINDYTTNKVLNDAITRYFVLLSMTFDISSIYKLYETTDKQIFRFVNPPAAIPMLSQKPILTPPTKQLSTVDIDFICTNCKNHFHIQGNFLKNQPLSNGAFEFPKDNRFQCPTCKTIHDLTSLRMDIEAQTKMKLI